MRLERQEGLSGSTAESSMDNNELFKVGKSEWP